MEQYSEVNPTFTIVTIVYNDKNGIEQTIQSVINQSFKDFEYIVIDGASNDGTVEIINKYKNEIDVFISEPDEGIYDAMNKGIKLSNGEWINFMNSGDFFFDDQVLTMLYEKKDNNFDAMYGSCKKVYDSGIEKVVKPLNINKLTKGMVFSHQSLFVKTSIHKARIFDDSFRLSADYDFIYYLFNNDFRFLNTKIIIPVVKHEGLSVSFGDLSIREAMKVHLKYDKSISKILYFNFMRLNRLLRNFTKNMLPKPVVNFFIEKKL
ncbi:MAG: glycosyltransferase [Leptolyngbya sp. SIO3F4]|nr:glycosyltransferase [Leptolyngbya sp. SIO3F4]